jgi:hypothetical protein
VSDIEKAEKRDTIDIVAAAFRQQLSSPEGQAPLREKNLIGVLFAGKFTAR